MRSSLLVNLSVSIGLVVSALAAPASVTASHPPATYLLPDLGMAPLQDFSVQRRPKGERRLRFSAIIVNVGAGPFQALGYQGDGVGELEIRQQLSNGAGGWADHDVTGTKMYFAGDGHNHWHVRDLEKYELVSQNGLTRRYGEKHGFCFWDNYEYNTALPGYPTTAQYTGTNSCKTLGDGTVTMGLSIGWGDMYPYYLTDQYIDITGLPAGEYTVTATADWANWFVESNDTNNSTIARIRISKNGATVLDPGAGP